MTLSWNVECSPGDDVNSAMRHPDNTIFNEHLDNGVGVIVKCFKCSICSLKMV
jgi:hypothetical protein